MAVPNIFGTATAAIPLSQLDTNFATPVTIGNTAVQLGNTVTSFGNVTLTNVTISSGNVTIAGANVSGTANVSTLVVTGNQSFVGTGNRILGDFSNATLANRVMFQTSTTNNNTLLGAIPNGTGQNARIQTFASSDPTNTATLSIESNLAISQAAITSGITGTGTYLPMTFYTGGSERVRIDTSGNVLVTSAAGLGYGTGSGGTVTQATSKATAVTLNKPTGRITMNNEALLPSASVIFALTNSLIAATDTVILSHSATAGTANAYVTQALTCGAGSVTIRVTNITAGSLSEAATINFAIIKGATS